jgi:hypothetical protein
MFRMLVAAPRHLSLRGKTADWSAGEVVFELAIRKQTLNLLDGILF